MATTRSFQAMLNDYLTYDLLKEEFIKRDFIMSRIEKDNGWKGASSTNNEAALIVPFKGAGASSVAYGELVATTNVSEDVYVRGRVNTAKELWGTMVFNHRDLIEHDGAMNEKSFLRILPDAVEDFMDYVKQVVSVNLLNGAHFAKLTADGANGSITVDHPERFRIGQEIFVDDDNSSISSAGYVSAIEMNTKVITVKTDRTYASPLDLQAYTTAQNAKVYHRGGLTASFQSIRGALLSATNGGDSSLHGVTKTSYPFMQAINVSGAAMTSANILDKIFDAYVTVRTFGQGNPNEIVMSYTNLGWVLKLLETTKGGFNVDVGSSKASVYGWTEIVVGGVKGNLKLIGVQEMDDDVMFLMDWRALKFHSNGFFRKRTAPDGKHYYEVRNTTGYQYFVDVGLFGELVVSRPAFCGVIHSIPTIS